MIPDDPEVLPSKSLIFIVGPGGVGKSTVGPILARKTGYSFIDLDSEYMEQIGDIGKYISKHGYEAYVLENSKLFYRLLREIGDDTVIVLPSGFLVHEGMDRIVRKHLNTLRGKGLIIRLLPDKDIEKAAGIVVRRQLKRGFGLQRDKEYRKYIHRHKVYSSLGNIKIYSVDSPENIAESIIKHLRTYDSNMKKSRN